MMSFILDGLPPEAQAALATLQADVPPMSPSAAAQVVREELGRDTHDIFLEWNELPAAAASIGQVHRGRWVDGREVAVKIQYPGAEEALLSDLRQIGRIAKTFGGLLPGIDVRALAQELQDRVAEELDYELEAEAQATFAEKLAGDPQFAVPAVVASSRRALVTEWMESPASLARIIESGTPDERDRYGELYARFMFEGPARTGLLHADPHPGNFRVVRDADGSERLGILDFGAVARLPEGQLPASLGRLMRIALMDDDYVDVVEHLRAEGFIKPSIRVRADDLRAYLGPFVDPAREDTFQFSRSYMRAQLLRMHDLNTPEMQVAFRLNLPPAYLLIHRTWVGGVGVLCQLEATVPFRRILEESMPGFDDTQ